MIEYLTRISSFLTNNTSFINLNFNLFETNIVNIVLLFIILFYAIKTAFKVPLKKRKNEIIQTLLLTQKDLLKSSSYYNACIKDFRKIRSLLEMGKLSYNKEKSDNVLSMYSLAKHQFFHIFLGTENLFKNFEKKSFIIIQRYIMLTIVGKIIRQFFSLSKKEQSNLIDEIILKLRGSD